MDYLGLLIEERDRISSVIAILNGERPAKRQAQSDAMKAYWKRRKAAEEAGRRTAISNNPEIVAAQQVGTVERSIATHDALTRKQRNAISKCVQQAVRQYWEEAV